MKDSEKLKNFRNKQGLSQQALADKLGLKQTQISMVESGTREASDSLKLAFFKKLNIDFDFLEQSNKNTSLLESIDKIYEASGIPQYMIKIPFYHVYAAAGSGEASPDYPDKDVIYFDKRWIKNVIGVKPYNVVFIQARGESMDGGKHPIKDGDLLMVDVSDKEPANNQVFVVRLSNQDLVVKRISQDWQGNITLCSDNPQYENIIPTEDDTFTVVGRVVWNGSKETV